MPLPDRLLRNDVHPGEIEQLTGRSRGGAWMFYMLVDPGRLNDDAKFHLMHMIEAMDATPALKVI